MKLSKLTDPQYGPLLSVVIGLLLLCIVYLVALLPFSPNQGAIGGALAALAVLLGAVIEVRGRAGRK